MPREKPPAGEFTESTIFPLATRRHSLEFLRGRFKQAGWCAHQVEQYLRNPSRSTYQTLYYFSSFRRVDGNGLSHSTCTQDVCTVDDISDRPYYPAHTPECSASSDGMSCRQLEIDLDQVKAVLRDGGIPVAEISVHNNGEVALRVCRVKAGIRYTAISHVWSHGLGNKEANAMLPCQLRSIHQAIRASRKLRRFVGQMEHRFNREVRRGHPGDRVFSLNGSLTVSLFSSSDIHYLKLLNQDELKAAYPSQNIPLD
jgi:hypothetical protein